MPEFMDWLHGLRDDLMAGADRADSLDDLFQVTFAGDCSERELASWCLAKMARAGCQDMRLLSALLSVRGSSEAADENVCWGLGELASYGIGCPEGLEHIRMMTDSPSGSARATAVWAAGMLRTGLSISDADLTERVRSLLFDDSPLVRMAAESYIG